ncbi:MAG: hypothetical protein ACE5MG_08930 [Candidatus Methylomirabilales bacterium]
MAKAKRVIDEKRLTKGELRRLNALRKSIGPDIGDAAFVKWWEQKQAGGTEVVDPNIAVIEDTLGKVISKLRFPRGGGYQIRRGRGRIIVKRLE